MLKIVLCDDDLAYQTELRQMIIRVLFEEENVIFECYADGQDLIQAAESKEAFYADLIFLDIKMPCLDGMQTARRLRSMQIDSAIVFVTSHEEYVFQGYEVRAYDYLLKPVTSQRMEHLLKRFQEERNCKAQQYLLIHRRMSGERVPLQQVCYFISDQKKICAVMEAPHAPIEFYKKMSELENELGGSCFLRCHQSFLVNKQKIKSWDGTSICLVNGEKIPVSKRYRGQLIQMLKNTLTGE